MPQMHRMTHVVVVQTRPVKSQVQTMMKGSAEDSNGLWEGTMTWWYWFRCSGNHLPDGMWVGGVSATPM